MRDFQIMRYIKRLWYFILIITLIGVVLVYFYTDKKQKYTAETTIQYTNQTAKEGLSPDGSRINPHEIYSAAVISNVKDDLNIEADLDAIRSACYTEPIISEDEERRKNAILDEGEEYNEVSDSYRIFFTANSAEGEDYARHVLDAIVNQYYIYYSRKYIDSAVIPNNSLNISTDKYDYINCVEIIDKSVSDIYEFLSAKEALYPQFRSARTGYTFEDLKNHYEYVRDYKIPILYAEVLGKKLTYNKEELLNSYMNRCDKQQILIENLGTHIKKEEELIKNFSKKLENSKVSFSTSDTNGQNSVIIRDVEDYGERAMDVETTYDELIKNLVSLRSEKSKAELELDYYRDVFSIFQSNDVTDNADGADVEYFEKTMNEIVTQLNSLYKDVEITSEESSEYSAAKNIKLLSGVYVEESINVELYMLMALLLFFVVGCAGAVLVGRIADMWEYALYVDKKTGIANRIRCDMVIDGYEGKILPANFACVVFKINNLNALNSKDGRSGGDVALKMFGSLIGEHFKGYGFVGYNSGNMFIAFLENCSKLRAQEHTNLVIEKALEKNNEIDITGGVAETESDGIFEIRRLLKKAIADASKSGGE